MFSSGTYTMNHLVTFSFAHKKYCNKLIYTTSHLLYFISNQPLHLIQYNYTYSIHDIQLILNKTSVKDRKSYLSLLCQYGGSLLGVQGNEESWIPLPGSNETPAQNIRSRAGTNQNSGRISRGAVGKGGLNNIVWAMLHCPP